jgi:hypothetical protein
VVDRHEAPAAVSLDSVLAADEWARREASTLLSI